jgi:hypothetical protein
MWWYANGRSQKGPVDDETMRSLIVDGLVTPDSLVWSEGLDSWRPCSRTRLAEHVPVRPPPLPQSVVKSGTGNGPPPLPGGVPASSMLKKSVIIALSFFLLISLTAVFSDPPDFRPFVFLALLLSIIAFRRPWIRIACGLALLAFLIGTTRMIWDREAWLQEKWERDATYNRGR